MKKKITCVIPTHNRNELAIRAVRSVILTGYSNIEIVIVDVASDPKFQLPDNLLTERSIRVIRIDQPSGGAVARNVGVLSSTGDYISFLDDDDELLPEKFKVMCPILDAKENIDAVIAECIIVDVKTQSQVVCSNKFYSRVKNTIKNRVHTNATLIRRSIFNHIKFNEKLSKFQDTQFNTDLCYLFNVFHLDIPVTKWYTNHAEGQITTRKGLFFSTKNYFKLIIHFLFDTKIPFYLLYEHFMRLIYLLIRLR